MEFRHSIDILPLEEVDEERWHNWRQSSCWFSYIGITNVFVSNGFITPWRIGRDPVTKRYIVTTPFYQQAIFVATHCLGYLVVRLRILEAFESIQTTTEFMPYFDFMIIIGFYSFCFLSDIVWCVKAEAVQMFLDELQNTPLLQISTQSSFLKCFGVSLIWILYSVTIFFCALTGTGMTEWDSVQFPGVVKVATASIFGVEEQTWSDSLLYPPLLCLTVIAHIQIEVVMILNDMFSVSNVFLLLTISQDLRKVVCRNSLPDEKIFELIDAQKRLTHKFNGAFGLACCMYSLYSSPYYAMYLIEILNSSGFMDRYMNILYLSCLSCVLFASMEINKTASELKRWMGRNERMLKLEHQRLALFIDDIEWERFGPGTFFVLDNGMAGEVVSLILTLAMITIQMK